ncbi:MAG: TolC family protein [Pirellulaceae bacterium]
MMIRNDRSPSRCLPLLTILMCVALLFSHGCAHSYLVQPTDYPAISARTSAQPAAAKPGGSTPARDSSIQPVVHEAPRQLPATPVANLEEQPDTDSPPLNTPHEIDLWQALQLGGANGLVVQLAQQRVDESHSRLLQAQSNWLPSVRLGLGYNRHDGQLQATHGEVVASSRNSLFVGGGLGLGQVPLAGGAGGPPRMMINFSLADACFEPLVANHQLTAEMANQDRTFNDAHLRVALTYIELLEAHALQTNALQSQQDIQALVKLTTLFADQGAGSQVEIDRAKTELSQHRLTLLDAERLIQSRSARLIQLLHLDSMQQLSPQEQVLHPMVLVQEDHDLSSLIQEGLQRRPELRRQQSSLDAAALRTCQETWRPWLPSVQVGGSAGSMGGGSSGSFTHQGARSDLDVLAFWEWRNLGIGNQAALWQRTSQLQQLETSLAMIRDQVAAEITTASQDIKNYRQQMKAAQDSLQTAKSSYQRNYQRMRQAEGLPIELLQAIRARTQSRDAYTRSVCKYNQAQFRLLRAIGQFPQPTDETPAPQE